MADDSVLYFCINNFFPIRVPSEFPITSAFMLWIFSASRAHLYVTNDFPTRPFLAVLVKASVIQAVIVQMTTFFILVITWDAISTDLAKATVMLMLIARGV